MIGCIVALVLAVLLSLGIWWVIGFGSELMEDAVRAELRGNPVIVEHIGEIQSVDLQLMASARHSGEDVYGFELQGTKGQGSLDAVIVTAENGGEEVVWAVLKLPDGRNFDVVEGQGPRPNSAG